MILWGPGQTRIDPFLHQPVSDWHIVERNKGFGLVVDDVWNIDYETIWRENIMDKYSRPYKDKEGNWVGGYIQKRFEVDKNIPVTNNMQLKPGELRKPILPQYGNTESRLQFARSEGKIEGADNISKPFNWKEASSKKKKFEKESQIKELKTPELKPLKFPGDPDPVKNIAPCPFCNSATGKKNGVYFCYNCNKAVIPKLGNPYQRKPLEKGERPMGFGPKDLYVTPVKAPKK